MFEHFGETARVVLVTAQEEARLLRHNRLGTEHLLLGVLRAPDSVGARALTNLGVTMQGTRAHVRRIVGEGQTEVRGQIPFTPRAERVLEYAAREALALGHNHVECEHIVLGLVREPEGVASRVLLDFDLDREKVRGGVRRMLAL